MDTKQMHKNQVYFNKENTQCTAYKKGQWLTFIRQDLQLDWKPVTEFPKQAGWYAGALLPRDYSPEKVEKVNEWRQANSFTKVWFNPGAPVKFWEPDPYGEKMRPLESITDLKKQPEEGSMI